MHQGRRSGATVEGASIKRVSTSNGGSRSASSGSAIVLLGLQRSAGNAAVQRLLSAAEFKKKTDVRLAKRGKTAAQLDRLLEEYDQLRQRGRHLQPGPGMDRAEQILNEIVQNTDFWLGSHQQDTSRSSQRRPGVRQLANEAAVELRMLRDIRGAGQEALGKDSVKDFELQENTFIADMQGDASSVLEKLGTVISATIPKPGDSVSAEITVKVPVDPSGIGYVGFRISAEAARMDDKATNVRFEVAVIGGGKVPGIADIGGEIGFFLQAQGETPQAAMKLISYGWYRRFRESRIPREVANFMWGGSTSSVGWVRAEQWAANVEKETFGNERDPNKPGAVKPLSSGVGSSATTNEFIRMGGLAKATAEGGVGGVAKLSGGVGVNAGVHYDRKSIGAKKQIGTASAMPARGKTTKLGTAFLTVDASLGAECGPFSGELSMSLELMKRARSEDSKKPEGYISASFSASAPVPINPALTEQLFHWVKKIEPKMKEGVDKIASKAASDKRTKGERAVTGLKTAGDTLTPNFGKIELHDFDVGQAREPDAPDPGSLKEASAETPEFEFDPADEYSVDTPQEQLASGLSVEAVRTLTLTFNAGYQFGGGRKEGWTLDIQLSQETGIDASASLAGLSLMKGSRLARIIIDPGGRKVSID